MSGLPDPEDVRPLYDRNAAEFHRARVGSEMEAGWVARFADALAPGAEVLDLGCGSGEPVARLLLDHGLRVTGADFSAAMLQIAARHLPGADWIRADIRTLDLDRGFDGIIAWHSFFHLTVAAQREALPRVLAHLRSGGVLVMTLGVEEGEISGHVEGEEVYHASLSEAEYRQILADAGVEVVQFLHDDWSCGGANVLFARRGMGD
ncbi:class I SAM-dependent DNA methyltransferase [Pseudooceanicola sp.]|uniref:class I SAM-dependent DNA methyltransferase n=1 Tax=Pseudooceanicola sp. TaxID=1914328 RepID=UPI0035C6B901